MIEASFFCLNHTELINCFDFLANSHFYNTFFLNLNGLSDEKVVSFAKNENGSSV